MSGHSKWSKVKHQKAGTDALKGSAFTKSSRAITVAVKEGGNNTDPDSNFRLRLAIDKARSVNMPKDTILRAIDRAAGDESTFLESVLYEAIGPKGTAFLIEAATDNRQRTVSEIKTILDRHGGHLASPGAVAYQFTHVGYIRISKTPAFTLDGITEFALEAGADDIVDDQECFELYCKALDLSLVKTRIQTKNVPVAEATLLYKPTQPVSLSQEDVAEVMTLIELLDANPDVQNVYSTIA